MNNLNKDNLKSGKEIVREFFDSLLELSDFNEEEKSIVKLIIDSYKKQKFSDKNFKDLLDNIIEKKLKNENKNIDN